MGLLQRNFVVLCFGTFGTFMPEKFALFARFFVFET